jgi:hypothetical protein
VSGVADEIALGDGLFATTRREHHLVQVGHPQFAAVDRPLAVPFDGVQFLELRRRDGVDRGRLERQGRPRRRQIRAPQPIRIGLDLIVGPTTEHRPWVVLGVPARDRILIPLVH